MVLSNLRKLQLLEVNLLQKFQLICTENHLTYYFVAGGLIGALRHGGFIPWDDDMDIVMPRDDYDRFVSICKKGVDGGYGLIHYDTDVDKNWKTAFSRFVDLKSVIEAPSAFESIMQKYVWIDLFPIDGMPKGKVKRWLHMQHIMLLRSLLIFTDAKNLAGKKKRSLFESFVLHVFKIFPIFKIFDSGTVCHILEKCIKKYRFQDSDYCCNFMGRYRSKEIQPKERWGTPATLLFEGIEVKVPEQYHEFQTHMYGDYMKLPPESERVAHGAKLIQQREIDFEMYEENSKKSRIEK